MVNFYKKIVILSNFGGDFRGAKTINGMVKLEKNSRMGNITVSLADLEILKSGQYLLGLKSGDYIQKVTLGSGDLSKGIFPLSDKIDLEDDILCVLFKELPSRLDKIAYGSIGGSNGINQIYDYINEKREKFKPKDETQNTVKNLLKDNEYIDEVVVTENYYEKNEIDNLSNDDKKLYKDVSGVGLATENPTRDVENEDNIIQDDGEFIVLPIKSKEKKVESDSQKQPASSGDTYEELPIVRAITLEEEAENLQDDILSKAAEAQNLMQDNIDAENRKAQKPSGELNYFKQIEHQLDSLFSAYPSEEGLKAAIEESKWAKIDFNNDGKYYVVGVIYNDSRPMCICYGVPDKDNSIMPKELYGYAEWLPIKASDELSGYWMMYQDCDEGKCITGTV